MRPRFAALALRPIARRNTVLVLAKEDFAKAAIAKTASISPLEVLPLLIRLSMRLLYAIVRNLIALRSIVSALR